MKHFKYESTAVIHWNFTRTLARQTMENSSQWHCEGLFNSLFNIALKKPKLYYITGLLWGESTGHRWNPLTKGQSFRKHFHVMSPCHDSEVLALCEVNPPVTGGFSSQRPSNAENISMSWHHHEIHPTDKPPPLLFYGCTALILTL